MRLVATLISAVPIWLSKDLSRRRFCSANNSGGTRKLLASRSDPKGRLVCACTCWPFKRADVADPPYLTDISNHLVNPKLVSTHLLVSSCQAVPAVPASTEPAVPKASLA